MIDALLFALPGYVIVAIWLSREIRAGFEPHLRHRPLALGIAAAVAGAGWPVILLYAGTVALVTYATVRTIGASR